MSEQKYLTKDGLEKIQRELDELKNVKRKEIIERIAEAVKLGDLSENAEYHEAKDAQGQNESRIIMLEDVVKTAVIVEDTGEKGVVAVGRTITVQGPHGSKEFVIVGSAEANPLKGFISNESPLGQAFMGRTVGETAEVEAPSGTVRYKITAIK